MTLPRVQRRDSERQRCTGMWVKWERTAAAHGQLVRWWCGQQPADVFVFFFSSRRRHTRSDRDWSSDVCSSDLLGLYESMRRNASSVSSSEEMRLAFTAAAASSAVAKSGENVREAALTAAVADRKSVV